MVSITGNSFTDPVNSIAIVTVTTCEIIGSTISYIVAQYHCIFYFGKMTTPKCCELCCVIFDDDCIICTLVQVVWHVFYEEFVRLRFFPLF